MLKEKSWLFVPVSKRRFLWEAFRVRLSERDQDIRRHLLVLRRILKRKEENFIFGVFHKENPGILAHRKFDFNLQERTKCGRKVKYPLFERELQEYMSSLCWRDASVIRRIAKRKALVLKEKY